MSNTKKINEKRAHLKALSQPIKVAVKMGVYPSINAGLIKLYEAEGHTELHSFKSWLKMGFVVKRGEKALLLWGEPLKATKEKPGEEVKENGEGESDFFPVAFVFSNKQVEQLKPR